MKNDDGESFSNATRGPPKELIESEAKLSLSLSFTPGASRGSGN